MDSVVHIQGKGPSTKKHTYPFRALTEDIPEEERAGNTGISQNPDMYHYRARAHAIVRPLHRMSFFDTAPK